MMPKSLGTHFITIPKKVSKHIVMTLDFSDDLFQADIHPNQNLVLDIGVPRWFQPNACFIIRVIQDCDWDKPLKKVCTNDIHILIQEIKSILAEYSVRL